MERPSSRDGWRQDLILGALVLAGVLLLMLPGTRGDAAAHPDLVRDLLLARNCQGGPCLSLGSPSSVAFFHGFAYNRFLNLLPGLGIFPQAEGQPGLLGRGRAAQGLGHDAFQGR